MKPVLTILTSIALTVPLSAQAEPVCMPTEELAASLKDWYGEVPVRRNIATGQQLWASERTGTWTLVQQRVDGTSCTLDSGEGYDAEGPSQDVMVLLED